MRIILTIIAISQETPPAAENIRLDGGEKAKLLGILRYATTVPVILVHISHI